MILRTRTHRRRRRLYFGIARMMLILGAANAALPAENGPNAASHSEEIRISRSLRNSAREPAQYPEPGTSSDTYEALSLSGTRSPPSGRESASNDFWFYTADVVLFNDDDRDGYYWGIDLLFDVDTYYAVADVYAVAYLSYEGGPWNEYAVTDTFSIFGASSVDEFILVTELLSAYPTGHYDILIELFDAHDGAFLASYGPADTSELSFLPLEDAERDDPHFDEIVVIGGGGAVSWWLIVVMLLSLPGAAFRNRSRASAGRRRRFSPFA